MRPIAIGRNNGLLAGSLRAGKRAAAAMSLLRSARLNGHDPYAYLDDVLERLRRSGRAASASCCRSGGKPLPSRPEHLRRRQDGIVGLGTSSMTELWRRPRGKVAGVQRCGGGR
jgi:hypothetical protein